VIIFEGSLALYGVYKGSLQLQQRKKKPMVKLMAIVLLCAGAYFGYAYATTFTGAQGLAFSVGGHAVTWLTVTAAALIMSVFVIVGKVKG